jgi:hypothetical protein
MALSWIQNLKQLHLKSTRSIWNSKLFNAKSWTYYDYNMQKLKMHKYLYEVH